MSRPSLGRILVVEDEPTLRLALQDALEAEGATVHSAADGNSGLELFRKHRHDIVLTDLIMPGLNGIQLIEHIHGIEPGTILFAITAYGNVETAVRAMKIGAADFITKPFSIQDLIQKIRQACQQAIDENEGEGEDELNKPRYGRLVGNSRAMRPVLEEIQNVAKMNVNVAICGESGTGRELVARAIHLNSRQSRKPFFSLACGASNEELLSIELFGEPPEDGHRGHPGLFETVQGGTLYFHEIETLSMSMQEELLKYIKTRTENGDGQLPRMIAATRYDLVQLAEQNAFLHDLAQRIQMVAVQMPKLSERRGDIRLLADSFLTDLETRLGRRLDGFSQNALAMLEKYSWPGNVRELKHAVEDAAFQAEGERIRREHLPEQVRRALLNHGLGNGEGAPPIPLAEAMAAAEKQHILNLLIHNHFRRGETAAMLKISRKTLWEKMKLYGIDPD